MKRLFDWFAVAALGLVFAIPAMAQDTKEENRQSERRDRSARQDGARQDRQRGQRGQRGQGRRGARGGNENALKVADFAPTFKLKSLDGKTETDLASFKGKKPVVLFFGSYT